MPPTARRLLGLCALLRGCASATPLPLHAFLEGSSGGGELGSFTDVPHGGDSSSDHGAAPTGPARVGTGFLGFLEENTLLVAVSGVFALLLLLVVCGAFFMSRRREVNAYYPSSFPSGMYVDGRDKTGGAKPFREVPEKATPERRPEAVDFHRQLQADIARAARSLRTPSRPAGATPEDGPGPEQRVPDRAATDGPELPAPQLRHPEEEKEEEERDEEERDEKEKEEEERDEEERDEKEKEEEERDEEEKDEEDSQKGVSGRPLRPSSLHLHSDSATLQLIAGEKTAF